MKRYLVFFLILLAACARGQTIRQKIQTFNGSATGIAVPGSGGSGITTVSIGTTQGILTKIIVQATGGTAGTSTDFEVRICTRATGGTTCATEGEHAIFQKQGLTTVGAYPFGIYTVNNIWFTNRDEPAKTQNLYVRIKNNHASSQTFDIYLAGMVTEGQSP